MLYYYEYQNSNVHLQFEALEKRLELGHFNLLFDWLIYETDHLQAFHPPKKNSGETN